MRACLLTMLFALVAAGAASAQPPSTKHNLNSLGFFWTRACPSLGCCADDYCKKACPALDPVPRCGGPNDYCRKTLPCLADVLHTGTCDDYCRKPTPSLLCPPWSPFLRCVPSCVNGRP